MRPLLLMTLMCASFNTHAQFERILELGKPTITKPLNVDESIIRIFLDMLPSVCDSLIKVNQSTTVKNYDSKFVNYPYSYLGSDIRYYYVPNKITSVDKVSMHHLFMLPTQSITPEVILKNLTINLRKSTRFNAYFKAVDSGDIYGNKFITFEQQVVANNKGLSDKINNELAAVAIQNPLQIKLETKQENNGLIKYVDMKISYGENNMDKAERIANSILKPNGEINFINGRVLKYEIKSEAYLKSESDVSRKYPLDGDSIVLKIIDLKKWAVEWSCKAIQKKVEVVKTALTEKNAIQYENKKEFPINKNFYEIFKIDQLKLSMELYTKIKMLTKDLAVGTATELKLNSNQFEVYLGKQEVLLGSKKVTFPVVRIKGAFVFSYLDNPDNPILLSVLPLGTDDAFSINLISIR